MKHTKGPWEVCTNPRNSSWLKGRTVYSVHERSRVADVVILRNDEQAFADARLIAAAPDLLTALDDLTRFMDRGWNLDQVLKNAHDAIAKATKDAA